MNRITSDAIRLSRVLAMKMVEGRHLMANNPSMESAMHFRDLINAHLHHVRFDLNTPAMEACTTPEQVINASMEGVGTLLQGLKSLFTKREKNATTKAEENESAKILADLEAHTKFMRAIDNRQWLSSAEYRTGPISMSSTAAALFFRGGKPLTSAQQIVSEFGKELNDYLKILATAIPVIKTYEKWCTETWDKCEKCWDEFKDSDELYAKIQEILKAQVKKRPKAPLEVIKVPKADRLGYQADDWNNSQTEWEIAGTPEQHGPLDLPSLDASTAIKLSEIFARTLDGIGRAEGAWDDVGEGVEGLDDYPWRDDTMSNALWDLNQGDHRVSSFDLHALLDQAHILRDISNRLVDLQGAIFEYLRAAIVTRP